MAEGILSAASGPGPGLVARLLRYGVVGTVVSLIYSAAVIIAVDGLGVANPSLASMAAFLVTLPIAYFAHRRLTFRDAVSDPFQPWRFAATATVNFVVATAGMYLLTECLGRSFYLGIAVNWLLIPGTNFLVYVLWVFRGGRVCAWSTP